MPADLTIEQLAAETGMTVRNIRAHQARGLLDPPEVRLRVGYYGAAARRAAQAHPRAPGRRVQPRRHQAAARGRPGHRPAPGPLSPGAQRDRRALADAHRGGAGPALSRERRGGAHGAGPGRDAGRARRRRRGPLRGPEPVAAGRRRAGGGPRRVAQRGADGVQGGGAALRRGLGGVRVAVHARGVGAVRGGRDADRALGGDRRDDRAAAAAWPPTRWWRSSASG